ncbi:MAG TPA: pyridoxamine 5'-phosphate oxidase family protein [Gemmatimonadales bacterium]|nr:pyridoxamine 5'-phosphate oxidase family protein [Gemmatimonadales bacterium]
MVCRLAALALSAVVAFPVEAPAQVRPAQPSDSAVLAAARGVMRTARYATMVTVGRDGHPQARIVDPFEPEGDMTIWVATNPATRKVRELERDPRVTLLYFDPADPGYVTLIGEAAVVNDRAERTKRWKPEWKPFYADENRGDDYVLIRVRPRRLEIVSTRHNLLNDPATWRPITIELR